MTNQPIRTITALASYFAVPRSKVENIIYEIFPPDRQPGRRGTRVWDFTHDELVLISAELHTPGSIPRPHQTRLPVTTQYIPNEDEMYDVFAEMALDGLPVEIPARLNWNIEYVVDQLRQNGYPTAYSVLHEATYIIAR